MTPARSSNVPRCAAADGSVTRALSRAAISGKKRQSRVESSAGFQPCQETRPGSKGTWPRPFRALSPPGPAPVAAAARGGPRGIQYGGGSRKHRCHNVQGRGNVTDSLRPSVVLQNRSGLGARGGETASRPDAPVTAATAGFGFGFRGLRPLDSNSLRPAAHTCPHAGLYSLRSDPSTRRSARALASVSSYSRSGMLSATMPAPACTKARPPAATRVRMAMAVSMLAPP